MDNSPNLPYQYIPNQVFSSPTWVVMMLKPTLLACAFTEGIHEGKATEIGDSTTENIGIVAELETVVAVEPVKI